MAGGAARTRTVNLPLRPERPAGLNSTHGLVASPRNAPNDTAATESCDCILCATCAR